MRSLVAVVLLGLVAGALAGCVATPQAPEQSHALPAQPKVSPNAFARDGAWSKVLAPAKFAIKAIEQLDVPSFDQTPIHIGLYKPDVPEGTKVPVILDAGPYYGNGEGPMDKPNDDRQTKFLIENFVPQGYAIALMSVRGTGLSGGCNDFAGDAEGKDIDGIVTWLGTQDWSNGNVGMTGKSYDGGTTWEAAQFGNPHLKTIVPLSGVTSFKQLHFANGTAEGRAPILWFLYWTMGIGGPLPPTHPLGPETQIPTEERPAEATPGILCADAAEGLAASAYSSATGDGNDALGYWAQRDAAPKALAKFNGSLLLEQGLQDWNVHPDQVFPLFGQFQGPKKALLGQWAHSYPDRPGDDVRMSQNPHSTRYDWAETLLHWFDKYLKGMDTDTGPTVDVEDNHGVWRTEQTWPPEDATDLAFRLGDGGKLSTGDAAAGQAVIEDPGQAPSGVLSLAGQDASDPLTHADFAGETLAKDLRISGMPTVPLTVIPTGPGGHAQARLYDDDGSGWLLVGHGQIDFKFADSTDQMKPVVPGQPLVLRIQLAPLDAIVPAGHRLVLRILQDDPTFPNTLGRHLPTPLSFPFAVQYGGSAVSELHLPTIERSAAQLASGWPFRADSAPGSAAQRP